MDFTLNKLSDRLQKDNRLEKICCQFANNYYLTPYFGVEIEFYLSKNIDILQLEELLNLRVKPEKGDCQFEIELPPTSSLAAYAELINATKLKVETIARNLGGAADFRAKPFLADYGSSMHFHLNFISMQQNNSPQQDLLLAQAAKSLCHFMLETFMVFAPNEEDYLRLDKNFMAPTKVSYGGNNRTTAVRIPDSLPKRLEHRLSSPTADPYLAMVTILQSILLGLESPARIVNFPKVYGNAFDEQYNLPSLPKSKLAAEQSFRVEFFD